MAPKSSNSLFSYENVGSSRWKAYYIPQDDANGVYSYEDTIVGIIEEDSTIPPLKNMIVHEANMEIPIPSHDDNATHIEDNQMDNEDEYYDYLILNPKYYKKVSFLTKVRVSYRIKILMHKFMNNWLMLLIMLIFVLLIG